MQPGLAESRVPVSVPQLASQHHRNTHDSGTQTVSMDFIILKQLLSRQQCPANKGVRGKSAALGSLTHGCVQNGIGIYWKGMAVASAKV